LNFYLASVDFTKAFDSVDNTRLWDVLPSFEVPGQYIRILQALYRSQSAKVATDVESRSFSVGRGVKQRDPISAILFTALLESVMRPLKKRWMRLNRKRSAVGYGITVNDPTSPLTNLPCADDLILIAQSKSDAGKMLESLRVEASKYGLELHMGKTKILPMRECSGASMKVGNNLLSILAPSDAERYLGRKLSMGNYHEVEVRNRISAAWASFVYYKAELCCRSFGKKQRLRLFDTVVTPCLLYGCAAWTLTCSLEGLIRTAQRRMLRWMLAARREPDQPWEEWIVRETHRVEHLAKRFGSSDWVGLANERKTEFATRTCLQEDKRWNKRLLNWRPHGHRNVGPSAHAVGRRFGYALAIGIFIVCFFIFSSIWVTTQHRSRCRTVTDGAS